LKWFKINMKRIVYLFCFLFSASSFAQQKLAVYFDFNKFEINAQAKFKLDSLVTHQKNIQKQEAEKQLNQWIESKAQQDQQKINESKAEANSKQENVNKLLENVNRIRSGNINRTINRSDLENILREK